jgi:hypothetical protein
VFAGTLADTAATIVSEPQRLLIADLLQLAAMITMKVPALAHLADHKIIQRLREEDIELHAALLEPN